MTIMVVDPNSNNASELVGLLQEIYPSDTVISFRDPLLSLKYGGTNPVDVLFAEAEMRRADGFTLFGTLKKFHPHIKAVITASDDSYRDKALILNVTAYLQRPISNCTLRNAIRRVAARDQPSVQRKIENEA